MAQPTVCAGARSRLSGGEAGRGALRRLRARLVHADALIDALHGHYSHLLHRGLEAEADALMEPLLRLVADAGGAYEALTRHKSQLCLVQCYKGLRTCGVRS